MKIEDFVFTEEDLIFEVMFGDYFAGKKLDVSCEARYYALKSPINIFLLFLKEEMLGGHYFRNFDEVGRYFVSRGGDNDRFAMIFDDYLLKRTYPPYTISKLEEIRNFFQDIGLNFNIINLEVEPLIQKQILEKNVSTVNLRNMVNKI